MQTHERERRKKYAHKRAKKNLLTEKKERTTHTRERDKKKVCAEEKKREKTTCTRERGEKRGSKRHDCSFYDGTQSFFSKIIHSTLKQLTELTFETGFWFWARAVNWARRFDGTAIFGGGLLPPEVRSLPPGLLAVDAHAARWGGGSRRLFVTILRKRTRVRESKRTPSVEQPLACACFFHWDILVVCLTVALKLAVTMFSAYIFRHSDRNDLIFFGHFKNVRPVTEKHPRLPQSRLVKQYFTISGSPTFYSAADRVNIKVPLHKLCQTQWITGITDVRFYSDFSQGSMQVSNQKRGLLRFKMLPMNRKTALKTL